jgi:hypothetical protein
MRSNHISNGGEQIKQQAKCCNDRMERSLFPGNESQFRQGMVDYSSSWIGRWKVFGIDLSGLRLETYLSENVYGFAGVAAGLGAEAGYLIYESGS